MPPGGEATKASFNEAEALKPRIPAVTGLVWLIKAQGINEAEALKPRIHRFKAKSTITDVRLQ